MQSIVFNGERPYTARVGSGAAGLLADELASISSGSVAVVTDSGVPQSHVSAVLGAAEKACRACHTLVLPAGESQKNLDGMRLIYDFLYDKGFTRSDCIIAVGGGVVGDMAGFAAATYLRGMAFVNVPTTIIAQTDSAYGGKTGVDYSQGKNHIGCFYPPKAVFCDTDFLNTLDEEKRLCGMGEVIKYGAIASPELLDIVEANGSALPDEHTVCRCVLIKKRFVEGDEHDNGTRRALNFGHTIGHAIEAASGYTVPHGQAVAYGMLAAASMGERLDVTSPGAYGRIASAAKAVGLRTDWKTYLDKALPLVSRDKKSDGASIDFVLLRDIGSPFRMALTPEKIAEIQKIAQKYDVPIVDSEGNPRDIELVKQDTERAYDNVKRVENMYMAIYAEEELNASLWLADAELVDNVAEGTVNILGEAVPGGKVVKDFHNFTKATLVGGMEAHCQGRSVVVGLVGGAAEGALTVGQNHLGDVSKDAGLGTVKKVLFEGTANVYFEGTKTVIHELSRGASVEDAVDKAQVAIIKKTGEVFLTTVYGGVVDAAKGGPGGNNANLREFLGETAKATSGELYSRTHDMIVDKDQNASQILNQQFSDWKNEKVEQMYLVYYGVKE